MKWTKCYGPSGERSMLPDDEMNWTKEPPTEPGWYWWYWHKGKYPVIIWVDKPDLQVYDKNAFWLGPLPVPEEPEE